MTAHPPVRPSGVSSTNPVGGCYVPCVANILIASLPATGHTVPLLPIARALVESGHHVRFLCGQRQSERICATGAAFVPYRHARDIDESRLDEAFPGRVGRTGLSAITFDIKHIFLDPALDMLRDVEAMHEERAIDLVLADVAYLGAQFFHERTGVPLIVVNIAPLFVRSRDVAPLGLALWPSATPLGRARNRVLHFAIENVLLRDVRDHFHALRARAGLVPRGWFVDSHERCTIMLHPSIPGLEYPRSDLPDNVHFVGRLPSDSGPSTPLPPWFEELKSAPAVVHVTQGTVANAQPHLIAPTLEALAHEDVLLVLTSGGRPLESLRLGALPANVRAAAFVPHAQLLPHTHVMLTNGGFGGVQIALAHGVPLGVAGASEEKPEVAARVAYAGAGIDLKSARPSPRAIRMAVRALLHAPHYRARAQELADEYARYDALSLTLAHVRTLL